MGFITFKTRDDKKAFERYKPLYERVNNIESYIKDIRDSIDGKRKSELSFAKKGNIFANAAGIVPPKDFKKSTFTTSKYIGEGLIKSSKDLLGRILSDQEAKFNNLLKSFSKERKEEAKHQETLMAGLFNWVQEYNAKFWINHPILFNIKEMMGWFNRNFIQNMDHLFGLTTRAKYRAPLANEYTIQPMSPMASLVSINQAIHRRIYLFTKYEYMDGINKIIDVLSTCCGSVKGVGGTGGLSQNINKGGLEKQRTIKDYGQKTREDYLREINYEGQTLIESYINSIEEKVQPIYKLFENSFKLKFLSPIFQGLENIVEHFENPFQVGGSSATIFKNIFKTMREEGVFYSLSTLYKNLFHGNEDKLQNLQDNFRKLLIDLQGNVIQKLDDILISNEFEKYITEELDKQIDIASRRVASKDQIKEFLTEDNIENLYKKLTKEELQLHLVQNLNKLGFNKTNIKDTYEKILKGYDKYHEYESIEQERNKIKKIFEQENILIPISITKKDWDIFSHRMNQALEHLSVKLLYNAKAREVTEAIQKQPIKTLTRTMMNPVSDTGEIMDITTIVGSGGGGGRGRQNPPKPQAAANQQISFPDKIGDTNIENGNFIFKGRPYLFNESIRNKINPLVSGYGYIKRYAHTLAHAYSRLLSYLKRTTGQQNPNLNRFVPLQVFSNIYRHATGSSKFDPSTPDHWLSILKNDEIYRLLDNERIHKALIPEWVEGLIDNPVGGNQSTFTNIDISFYHYMLRNILRSKGLQTSMNISDMLKDFNRTNYKREKLENTDFFNSNIISDIARRSLTKSLKNTNEQDIIDQELLNISFRNFFERNLSNINIDQSFIRDISDYIKTTSANINANPLNYQSTRIRNYRNYFNNLMSAISQTHRGIINNQQNREEAINFTIEFIRESINNIINPSDQNKERLFDIYRKLASNRTYLTFLAHMPAGLQQKIARDILAEEFGFDETSLSPDEAKEFRNLLGSMTNNIKQISHFMYSENLARKQIRLEREENLDRYQLEDLIPRESRINKPTTRKEIIKEIVEVSKEVNASQAPIIPQSRTERFLGRTSEFTSNLRKAALDLGFGGLGSSLFKIIPLLMGGSFLSSLSGGTGIVRSLFSSFNPMNWMNLASGRLPLSIMGYVLGGIPGALLPFTFGGKTPNWLVQRTGMLANNMTGINTVDQVAAGGLRGIASAATPALSAFGLSRVLGLSPQMSALIALGASGGVSNILKDMLGIDKNRDKKESGLAGFAGKASSTALNTLVYGGLLYSMPGIRNVLLRSINFFRAGNPIQSLPTLGSIVSKFAGPIGIGLAIGGLLAIGLKYMANRYDESSVRNEKLYKELLKRNKLLTNKDYRESYKENKKELEKKKLYNFKDKVIGLGGFRNEIPTIGGEENTYIKQSNLSVVVSSISEDYGLLNIADKKIQKQANRDIILFSEALSRFNFYYQKIIILSSKNTKDKKKNLPYLDRLLEIYFSLIISGDRLINQMDIDGNNKVKGNRHIREILINALISIYDFYRLYIYPDPKNDYIVENLGGNKKWPSSFFEFDTILLRFFSKNKNKLFQTIIRLVEGKISKLNAGASVGGPGMFGFGYKPPKKTYDSMLRDNIKYFIMKKLGYKDEKVFDSYMMWKYDRYHLSPEDDLSSLQEELETITEKEKIPEINKDLEMIFKRNKEKEVFFRKREKPTKYMLNSNLETRHDSRIVELYDKYLNIVKDKKYEKYLIKFQEEQKKLSKYLSFNKVSKFLTQHVLSDDLLKDIILYSKDKDIIDKYNKNLKDGKEIWPNFFKDLTDKENERLLFYIKGYLKNSFLDKYNNYYDVMKKTLEKYKEKGIKYYKDTQDYLEKQKKEIEKKGFVEYGKEKLNNLETSGKDILKKGKDKLITTYQDLKNIDYRQKIMDASKELYNLPRKSYYKVGSWFIEDNNKQQKEKLTDETINKQSSGYSRKIHVIIPGVLPGYDKPFEERETIREAVQKQQEQNNIGEKLDETNKNLKEVANKIGETTDKIDSNQSNLVHNKNISSVNQHIILNNNQSNHSSVYSHQGGTSNNQGIRNSVFNDSIIMYDKGINIGFTFDKI